MDTTHKTVGFADVGYDEALRRARELIPFLREQAPKCEEARKLTPAVMGALTRNGLLRYLQPKVWGGMELPFVAYFDVPEMLSRGDAAVGWTVQVTPSAEVAVAIARSSGLPASSPAKNARIPPPGTGTRATEAFAPPL